MGVLWRSEGGMGSADPVESLESGYENQFEGPFPRLKFILLVS